MTPHRLFPSLCACFSRSSFTSMFMKWICFSKFQMYSSSMFKFGLRPSTTEPALFSLLTPSEWSDYYACLPTMFSRYSARDFSSWNRNYDYDLKGWSSGAFVRDNNFMKTNFDINIPSIPSNIIKFKIQDIKSTAFGSQRGRFNENKGFLTKKFIESFNNFHQKQPPSTPTTTAANEESRVTSLPRSQAEYRFLIPEEKKYMLHHYEKYKDYEAPLLNQTKYNRGYSFYKTDSMAHNRQSAHSVDQNLTDNFYFPAHKDRPHPEHHRQPQPTCVFKNETRKRVYSKLEKAANAIPGPGAYLFPAQPKPPKNNIKQDEEQAQFDYKNLKQIITNIVSQPPQDAKQEEDVPHEEKRISYMFVEDDRDRFGNQKYPIAQRVNVPGPGAYQVKDSLEDHAKKILLVEEQRKLLKEWFNN